MEIKEFLRAKTKLELEIARYLNSLVSAFNEQVGDDIVVDHITVHVVDTSTYEKRNSTVVDATIYTSLIT